MRKLQGGSFLLDAVVAVGILGVLLAALSKASAGNIAALKFAREDATAFHKDDWTSEKLRRHCRIHSRTSGLSVFECRSPSHERRLLFLTQG